MFLHGLSLNNANKDLFIPITNEDNKHANALNY